MSTSFKAWLLSPVLLLGVSAGRLLLVANYDATTAMTISSTVGAISTLLGTMIPILSAYLPALTLFFAVIRSWRSATVAGVGALFISPAQSTFSEGVDGVGAQASNLWAALRNLDLSHLTSRWDLAVLVYAGLWVAIGEGLRRRPPSAYAFYLIEPEETDEETERTSSAPVFARSLLALGIFCGGMTLFLFVQNAYSMTFTLAQLSHTARLPWMPPEEITFEHPDDDQGQQVPEGEKTGTQVAYVLSVTGEWTILLQEGARTISYIPSSDVKARQVCELPATSTAHDPPLLKLPGAERPALQPCQEQDEQ